MQEKEIQKQRAQWVADLAEIRAEEEKNTEKHILLCAVISLLMILCSLKINYFLAVFSYIMNVQIYRYFKKYNCKVEKFGLDMKMFAIVASVSIVFMLFMPIFITADLFVNAARMIYGIAALCAILNEAYICVYLYGARK